MTRALAAGLTGLAFVLVLGLLLAAPPPAGAEDARTDAYGDPLPPGAVARCGTTRFRGGGGGVCTPDGRFLAVGDGILDTTTGKRGPDLAGYGRDVRVNAVALSADGRRVATGSDDLSARVWDATTGKEVRRLEGFVGPVYAVALSPDGGTLATSEYMGPVETDDPDAAWKSARLRFFDVASGRELGAANGERAAAQWLGFAPDGRTLASLPTRPWVAIDDNEEADEVYLWEVPSGRKVRDIDCPGQARSVAYGKDGRALVVGTHDGKVVVFEAATEKELSRLEGAGTAPVYAVALSPDGKRVAYFSSGAICLWDVAEPRARTLFESTEMQPVLAFTPDGGTLVADDGFRVRRFDLASGRAPEVDGHQAPVTSVVFHPGGKTLASGSDDGTIRLWDAATGKEVQRIEGRGAATSSIAFAPDGKTMLSWGGFFSGTIESFANDGAVYLWDVATGKEVRRLLGPGPIHGVAVAPDGATVAITGPSGLVLWRLATGERLHETSEAGSRPGAVSFSPDGRLVAWADSRPDEKQDEVTHFVRLLDVASGKELPRFDGPEMDCHTFAFSPDGATVITNSVHWGQVFLWDVASRKLRLAVDDRDLGVLSVAFSPDGKTFAVRGGMEVSIREPSAGKEVRRIAGHEIALNAVAYSPDGELLATAGWDRAVLIWDLAGGE